MAEGARPAPLGIHLAPTPSTRCVAHRSVSAQDFKENHTDTTVSFTVTALSGAKLDEAEKAPGGLLKKFKLESSMVRPPRPVAVRA